MKKIYLLSILFFSGLCLQAQMTSNALKGTCVNPDEGTVDFIFDLNVNCPEADPNGTLPGTMEMGFHSGANDWATIIEWDAAGASNLVNNGADSFLLTVNVVDYYGLAFGDVTDIQMVINNGFADPADPWIISFRDSLDGDNFGNPDPCSNLKLYMNDIPTCSDLNQASSLVLFSDAGDSESCVDAAAGLVRIDLDYDLTCLEGDQDSVLLDASALGFHSGANDWAQIVAWDDPGAVQLVNDGNNNFSAIIDAAAYYGIPFGDIVDIHMLGNNGPADAVAAWDNTLKDPTDGGSFGNPDPCSNIIMKMAEAPACDLSVGTNNIVLQRTLKVNPNPFRNRAFLEFDNPNNEAFNLVVTDLNGRVVRTMTSISGERVLIERENLPEGMYFATLSGKDGDFATTKLVVK